MKTRDDYMNKGISHADYYRQFVTEEIKSLVNRKIGVDRIARSKDQHLNDIPLNLWERMHNEIMPATRAALKQAGDFPSLSSSVCIAKQAARMLIEAISAAA